MFISARFEVTIERWVVVTSNPNIQFLFLTREEGFKPRGDTAVNSQRLAVDQHKCTHLYRSRTISEYSIMSRETTWEKHSDHTVGSHINQFILSSHVTGNVTKLHLINKQKGFFRLTGKQMGNRNHPVGSVYTIASNKWGTDCQSQKTGQEVKSGQQWTLLK